MKAKRTGGVAQMRAEYDLDYSKAERGKYHKRLLKEGSNVVVLDRDVAKKFPDSASVNKALRSLIRRRQP
jgi:adenine/guanine phosphoribosyltransferase-like PRPP-binding protein